MTYNFHGRHLIAGNKVAGATTFQSNPANGMSGSFSNGTAADVDAACHAAEDAFWSYAYAPAKLHAQFLEAIADEIETRGDAITQVGVSETGLPPERLVGERDRTTSQLRLFAAHIRAGSHLDRRHDTALPDRQPLPRPDIRLVQRPVGPVAIFGASNFPLAFSTAGGDTAAALAAGCPVVVKGHPAHPGTGEIVADAIDAARRALDLHPGVFSHIQGSSHDIGAALVCHEAIKAVGFTGSLRGGRMLFDLCAARPEPIPFYGELGSINPMFLLPHAATARGQSIGEGWAGSLTMGAGQFCTNPGVVLVMEGPDADTFVASAATVIKRTATQIMLTDEIARAYDDNSRRAAGLQGVDVIVHGESVGRRARPVLMQTSGSTWRAQPALREEIFGPLGIVISVADEDEMLQIAQGFEGQLTATLHMDDGDLRLATRLLPILERKVGRVLANGYPTGVEVCDAMVHGGPYPASTNFGATSVGTLSIRRFLRPVSYQNLPADLIAQIEARY